MNFLFDWNLYYHVGYSGTFHFYLYLLICSNKQIFSYQCSNIVKEFGRYFIKD